MARKRRVRRKYKFFLTISNQLDRMLADKLDHLRKKTTKGRNMTEYIRNGVLLYASLRDEGSLVMLFELFPWVKEIVSPQIDTVISLQKQMGLLEQALLRSNAQEIPSARSLPGLISDVDDNYDTEPLTLQVATNTGRAKGSGVDAFLMAFEEVSR